HHIGTVRNAYHQSIMNKRTKVLCKDCHRKVTNQQIHDIRKNKRLSFHPFFSLSCLSLSGQEQERIPCDLHFL
ncbi:MAG: hypothetical protein Q8886_02860, partial [Candidatus Phytoplasma australasiaticum]|nr:hypothetical protein [Candidatus Phytoplasma australasiaticum]